jgi:hypothetical protein
MNSRLKACCASRTLIIFIIVVKVEEEGPLQKLITDRCSKRPFSGPGFILCQSILQELSEDAICCDLALYVLTVLFLIQKNR